MKQIFILLFLIVLSSSLFSQVNKKSIRNVVDSLNFEIQKSENDSLKAEHLIVIADIFQNKNPDSSFYYAEKALMLAEKCSNFPVQVGALGFISGSLVRKGNLPKALEMAFRALGLGKGIPVRLAAGIGPSYWYLGEIYREIGDYNRAMQFYKKVIALGDDDIMGVAIGNYGLATLYEKANKLDSAIFFLDESYRVFSTLHFSHYPEVYDVYPPWYNTRASIYIKQNKPQLALKDLFTSLEMTINNDESYHTSNTYNDISSFYKQFNQRDSAIIYAEKGINEASKISSPLCVLKASELLADQYEEINPAKALHFLKLANETRNKLYGAGNIQIIRDMIAQNEKKQEEIKAAKTAFQNRLRMNAILGITFTLLIIAIFLFRNNRTKQKAKLKIELAFNQLKSTQAQLIQSEKMASLGELTAGIAHEIQNPLNFVNNFSDVNSELLTEAKEELKNGDTQETENILNDIIENEQKIKHHGQRASDIVKGMLAHSRTSSGQKELTDINALADEYLRLAYHGMKAKDKSFNADFKLEADENLPKINVIPQDIGRVLLNLINNAFYACAERSRSAVSKCGVGSSVSEARSSKPEAGSSDYKPEVTVRTKKSGDKIEISVKDNGPGIPSAIVDKIFQPFFTTKPTGQGTGLGLSLSYDIVKAHGGEIRVESKEGEGSEFIIYLLKHASE